MRGEILEIRVESPREAAAVLKRQMPNASVGLFGDRLHVVGLDARQTAAEAEVALKQAGLIADSIQQIKPSLEDVFVSMMAEEGPETLGGSP